MNKLFHFTSKSAGYLGASFLGQKARVSVILTNVATWLYHVGTIHRPPTSLKEVSGCYRPCCRFLDISS